MPTQRHGGPGSDGESAALEILAAQSWVAVCVEDGDGALRCTPALLRGLDGKRAQLDVPDGQPPISGSGPARAALVADEFRSYKGIRGVIARGLFTQDGDLTAPPTAEFQLRHIASFSFAGRLPVGLPPEDQRSTPAPTQL